MYNITGWSGGGRRPLSYNLMPGQFRNTRVNVFSQPMIINNNIGGFGGCYDYDCGCGCGGSNKMSWMDWTMMGGMLLNGLGNLFACFWGGGGGGGAEKAKADTPNDKTLKTQAQELAEVYGVDKGKVKVIDGTIYVNINGKVTKCEDLEELEKVLEGIEEADSSQKPDGEGGSKVDPGLKKRIETDYPDIKITDDGQFEVNGTKYKTLKDAINVLEPEKTKDFPNLLFKSGTVKPDDEENKFKELNQQDVYKIDSNFSEITIDKVIDQGNNTTFDISDVKITKNNDGTLQCNPTKVNGKDVSATILGDKYIQLKVGDQTYIVAKDNNAYQYENGNVTGYNDANWRQS